MIVFASHGSSNYLESALNSLNEFNKKDVLVIDTNSKNDNINNFYSENKDRYNFNLFYEKLNYDSRDSGGYIHAIRNYNYDTFYFFHDSIEFINNKIFDVIDGLLYHPHSPVDVVAVSPFKMKFDSDYQKKWAMDKIDINENEVFNLNGIMGPMFSIKRETFNKIPEVWLNHPTNKVESCGMERRWSMIFYKLNLYVSFLEIYHELFLLNEYNNFLKKIVLRRV